MADESKEAELADATHVRVLETNLLHASDVIYWLDGSSAAATADMSRVDAPLQVVFTEKPKAIHHLHSSGKTAFWQTPTQAMHVGSTTDNDRVRPAQANFDVAGTVADSSRRFLPVQFDLTLGSGNGHAVTLYPSPAAVQSCAGGIVFGRVLNTAGNTPLTWALLTLTITVGVGEDLVFRGQTDHKGDFRMAMKTLPPLPLNTNEYSATLRINGDVDATAETPVNISNLPALNIESVTQAGSFSQQVALTIRPGLQQRINSMNKLFIAVQSL